MRNIFFSISVKRQLHGFPNAHRVNIFFLSSLNMSFWKMHDWTQLLPVEQTKINYFQLKQIIAFVSSSNEILEMELYQREFNSKLSCQFVWFHRTWMVCLSISIHKYVKNLMYDEMLKWEIRKTTNKCHKWNSMQY